MPQRLTILVDDVAYVRSNCYLRQLLWALEEVFTVKLLPVQQALNRPRWFWSDDRYFSMMRFRSLANQAEAIKKRIGDKPVIIYDQDPWESFIDAGSLKGAYERIVETLNVVSFVNTSKWWSDFVRTQGFPSQSIRMGIHPNLCSTGRAWEERSWRYAFQGTVHPYRKEFFDALESRGVSVETRKSVPHEDFLKGMREAKTFLHIGNPPWAIDGIPHESNCPWVKDIEIVAQGCYSLRNWDEEATNYFVDKIPTIVTFQEVDEVPSLIASIEAKSPEQRHEEITQSVAFIAEHLSWTPAAHLISDVVENRP